jgi:hypothetical protein
MQEGYVAVKIGILDLRGRMIELCRHSYGLCFLFPVWGGQLPLPVTVGLGLWHVALSSRHLGTGTGTIGAEEDHEDAACLLLQISY